MSANYTFAVATDQPPATKWSNIGRSNTHYGPLGSGLSLNTLSLGETLGEKVQLCTLTCHGEDRYFVRVPNALLEEILALNPGLTPCVFTRQMKAAFNWSLF